MIKNKAKVIYFFSLVVFLVFIYVLKQGPREGDEPKRTAERVSIPKENLVFTPMKNIKEQSVSFEKAELPLVRDVSKKRKHTCAPLKPEGELYEWLDIDEIPHKPLVKRLEKLSVEARNKAFVKIQKLQLNPKKLSELQVSPSGNLYYHCDGFQHRPLKSKLAAKTQESREKSGGKSPVSTPPVFHSRPGSESVIYLDFNGGVVTGTVWNDDEGVDSWTCLAFDSDNDYSSFSLNEREDIEEIWKRVSEDFAPFDVDVTTEPPDTFTPKTLHVMITETIDANNVILPHDNSGGYAYIDIFNYNGTVYDSPAWVNGSYYVKDIAELASHEVGHNFGLSHDGTANDEYYDGHSNGPVSWGPIMGSSYKDVTQWSKGGYYDADNFEDDLAILAAQIPYELDDHGNSLGQASVSQVSNNSISLEARIHKSSDIDYFKISVGKGDVFIDAKSFQLPSYTWGSNLDVKLKFLDQNGLVLAENNPADDVHASIFYTVTVAGDYFISIQSTGVGSPENSSPTGYSNYGSIGTYTLDVILPVVSYRLTYDANGAGVGTAPDDIVEYASGASIAVLGQSDMLEAGHLFNGWNTAVDGSGIAYAVGGTLAITANTTLFAQWAPHVKEYQLKAGYNYISYNGASPIDAALAFKPLMDADQLEFVRTFDLTSGRSTYVKERYSGRQQAFYWDNGIGDLTNGQGYIVNVNVDVNLILPVIQAQSPMTYDLKAGYNYVGYNGTGIVNAQMALQPLIDNGKLEFVRTFDLTSGRSTYLKERYSGRQQAFYWDNGIGDLIDGQGYIINLNADHNGFQWVPVP